jgi:hypothetical protein
VRSHYERFLVLFRIISGRRNYEENEVFAGSSFTSQITTGGIFTTGTIIPVPFRQAEKGFVPSHKITIQQERRESKSLYVSFTDETLV